MSFSRLIETLLLRDILSYVVPGSLILAVMHYAGFDAGILIPGLKAASITLGQSGALLAFGVLSYVTGYTTSTTLFYLRDAVSKRKDPGKIHPDIKASLRNVYGGAIDTADARQIVSLCLHYVEYVHPDYYQEKVERRVSLRNLEIGLAGVLLTATLGTMVVASPWWKCTAILPLVAALAFLASSRNLDAAIDRLGIRLFQVAIGTSRMKRKRTEPEFPATPPTDCSYHEDAV